MSIFFITIIVGLVAVLVFSFRKSSELTKEKQQLLEAGKTAQEIANQVVSSHDLNSLPQYILEASLSLIPKANHGIILVYDAEGRLAPKASIGFSESEVSNYRLALEETPIYSATAGKLDRTVKINKLQENVALKNNSTLANPDFPVKSEISSPLYTGGELAGLLCIGSEQNDVFTDHDLSMAEYMANQLRIVMNNQKLYREIQHLTRFDSLSYLLNRESFEMEATRVLSDPSKDTTNLYFVLMDLDDVREANDKYGHDFGDEIIRTFSEIIRNHLSRNAICGRYGGDEFAAVIQGDYLNVVHLLDEIKKEFMDKRVGNIDSSYTPNFTYGLASFLEGSCDLSLLYKLADEKVNELKIKRQKEQKKAKA